MSTLPFPGPPAAALVLGIDPGPSTGIVLLSRGYSAQAFQCNADAAPWLVRAVLGAQKGFPVRGGIEAFAPGHGAGATMKTGKITRDLVVELAGIAADCGVPLQARFASVVKAWATDKRLREAGLYELTSKAPDARDAARHALFCAVHDCGYPDPLSRRAG